jgi:hypothetical protein
LKNLEKTTGLEQKIAQLESETARMSEAQQQTIEER